MKNKNDKGITLIALVVTIIILLILASVTTYSGIDAYKRAKVTNFVTQMQLLQAKIDDLVSSKTEEELNNIELQTVTTQEQIKAITNAFKQEEIAVADTSKYKVFTKDKVLEILDIDDIKNDILVNFETREIVSIEGIEYEGSIYYTQYKLPGGQNIINNSIENQRDLTFEIELETNGLNATITIIDLEIENATLIYSEKNSENWKTVTNCTKNGEIYTIQISKTGDYIIKISDNTNKENYEEKDVAITLTNKPKTGLQIGKYNYGSTSDKWAYVQKDNENYVWIPRFAYKINLETNVKEIKFIKGNSNISTENTYIDDTWEIHDIFTTDDETELTGIWVSVENANQTELDMINLLNKNDITTKVEI